MFSILLLVSANNWLRTHMAIKLSPTCLMDYKVQTCVLTGKACLLHLELANLQGATCSVFLAPSNMQINGMGNTARGNMGIKEVNSYIKRKIYKLKYAVSMHYITQILYTISKIFSSLKKKKRPHAENIKLNLLCFFHSTFEQVFFVSAPAWL